MKNLDPIFITIPEGLEAIVPDYLASRQEEVSELLRLLAASDCDHIRVLAHNMKGSGGSYGFTRLTEIGAEMECSARESNVVALSQQIGSLTNYLERVRLQPPAPIEYGI